MNMLRPSFAMYQTIYHLREIIVNYFGLVLLFLSCSASITKKNDTLLETMVK